MTWTSPDGMTRYTHGPDCDSGPGCCCGKCMFVNIAVDCGNTVCCKCVPKWLCMIFIPNEDQVDCMVREVTVPYANSWQGSLAGIDPEGTNHLIEVLMFQEEDGPCMFRVFIPARDIQDDYVIDGGLRECSMYPEFRQTCRDPYFQYDDFVIGGCTGTLIIKRKELEKVPFHSSKEGLDTSTIEMPEAACGPCTEYCRVLCLEWTVGGETQKSEFRIQEGESPAVWNHRIPDGELATITLEEIEGVCHLVIDHEGLGIFDKVPIPYQMCNLGMVIEHSGTIEGAAGKFVSISCNRCTCWDYICETCRCVCPTMCIVSVDGPEQTDVTYYDLEWDPVLIRWGTAEKWVAIRANPDTGKCEYVISGWNSDPEADYDAEASTIEIEECGKDMSYYITSSPTEALSTGIFKFEYGVCKTCNPDCFKYVCDDCCGECDSPELPDTLFFDIVGSAVAGEPEGSPPCLAVYDIPLVHTMPLFAESHRWEGHAIVDCTAVFESPPGPNSVLIDIRISCSGDTWTLVVRLTSVSATGTPITVNSNDPIWTTSFTCSPVAWVGKLSSDLVITKCCGGVFEFDFAVSE